MTFAMSPTDRETFLTGVRVGVLSVEDPGHGPLTVPVWYAYEPGGTVDVVAARGSVKARRLRAAGRFSLGAQGRDRPLELCERRGSDGGGRGPGRTRGAPRHGLSLPRPGGVRPLSRRHEEDAPGSVMFRLAPERWRSTDYAKQSG